MSANFTPTRGAYTELKPFRFWCQKVLPLVYDDSLSYYELLCKVVDYLNKTMEDVETLEGDVTSMYTAYEQLQGYVNNYFDQNIPQLVSDKLDEMAEDGTLTALITPVVTDTIDEQLPGEVAEKIGDTVAGQIGPVVSNQIGPVVSNQIGPVVDKKIGPAVADWLEDNVSATTPAVDRTLSILNAAADAAFTGARIDNLDDAVGYEHISDVGAIITTATPYIYNYGYIVTTDSAFRDGQSHTYKVLEIPVATGDKYRINAHKISIANVTADHFAVTYAFCAKWVDALDPNNKRYYATAYNSNAVVDAVVTAPEIEIPTGQGYDETTGYLVVITADIQDPVYKVTESEVPALRDDLRKNENLESALKGTFENGGLDADGVPYETGYQFRVRNSEFIKTDDAWTVEIADGFRIIVDYYTNNIVSSGAFAGNSGWQTGTYTFSVDHPYYKVVIARVSENSSETANISEFVSAVKTKLVKTVLDTKGRSEQNVNDINKMLTVTPVENSGYISANGSISSASTPSAEKYTDKIPVKNGDIVKLTITWADSLVSKWVAVAYYDVDGTFESRDVLTNANVGEFSTVLSIVNDGYIVFTYRTYNDYSINIIRNTSLNNLITNLQKTLQKTVNVLNNGFVNSINHRGYNTVAPENTLPAYRLSKTKGFNIVETDISYTSDNVPVLLHDNTINRTARNTDGTTISETINISDITYEQALSYDFGIWKGSEYAGTKIPTFEEFIVLCKNIGLNAYVELKNTGGGHETLDRERTEGLIDTVIKYGMDSKITWIADSIRFLGYVKDYNPKARIGYVTSNISANSISNAQSVKTAYNEVFIDSRTYTAEEIELCSDANIPLEIWTVNNENTITNIDSYVSGITSDSLIAGQILYQKYI